MRACARVVVGGGVRASVCVCVFFCLCVCVRACILSFLLFCRNRELDPRTRGGGSGGVHEWVGACVPACVRVRERKSVRSCMCVCGGGLSVCARVDVDVCVRACVCLCVCVHACCGFLSCRSSELDHRTGGGGSGVHE